MDPFSRSSLFGSKDAKVESDIERLIDHPAFLMLESENGDIDSINLQEVRKIHVSGDTWRVEITYEDDEVEEFDDQSLLPKRKKSDFFVQCRLVEIGDRAPITTSWVPLHLAKKGKKVEMKMDGEWRGPWVIDEVHKENKVSGDQLEVLEDEYRYHRERTDV